MYEELVGKRVQVTMLKDGNEEMWQPQKVTEFNDGILLLADGSEADTKRHEGHEKARISLNAD